MRSAAAGLIVLAGNVMAHPDHGAPEGHFHGWGFEHALLLAAIALALAFALRKK